MTGLDGTYHYIHFDDVPQRISDGWEYIAIACLGAHSVLMREPEPDEFDASVEPEAA